MFDRVRRMAAGAAELWRELDYAQRRLFELQTALPEEGSGAVLESASAQALEALWSLPARDPAAVQRRGV